MESMIGMAKNLFCTYFLCMLLLQFVGEAGYRRLLRFFLSILLILQLLQPFFQGGKRQIYEQMLQVSFLQDLQQFRWDMGKELYEDRSRSSYIKVLEKQVLLACEQQGYKHISVQIEMDENMQISHVLLQGKNASSLKQCRSWLCDIYGFRKEQVVIQ